MPATVHLNKTEFVCLTALLMSLVALAIDMLLPALPAISAELGLQDANQAQYIISAVFVGMIAGKLLFGPISDAWGRKPAIHLGLVLFIIGSLVCYFSSGLNTLLLGRLLQGVGVASPRIVCVALVRDQYEGREMARIMSFVMMVFILVPAIAPALGQLSMQFASWRIIFIEFLVTGLISLLWFSLRQTETLTEAHRRPLSMRAIIDTAREILTYPAAIAYTLAIGLVFASFVGYLVSSQQIFDLIYQRGGQFPYYFGMLALVIGSASIINARFVMKVGMRKLSTWALYGIVVFSLYAIYLEAGSTAPMTFEQFLLYCVGAFFCIGILFGNLNALAMEPLGHIAGMGAALIGACSTIISVVFGTLIGQAISDDVMPMLIGFLLTSILTLLVFYWVGTKSESEVRR